MFPVLYGLVMCCHTLTYLNRSTDFWSINPATNWVAYKRSSKWPSYDRPYLISQAKKSRLVWNSHESTARSIRDCLETSTRVETHFWKKYSQLQLLVCSITLQKWDQNNISHGIWRFVVFIPYSLFVISTLFSVSTEMCALKLSDCWMMKRAWGTMETYFACF